MMPYCTTRALSRVNKLYSVASTASNDVYRQISMDGWLQTDQRGWLQTDKKRGWIQTDQRAVVATDLIVLSVHMIETT
jgi:hypothetical protein